MSEDDKRRGRRRLIKGILGPSFYQPKKPKPPTKLRILGRRIMVGAALWMLLAPLLTILFENSPLSIIAYWFAVGGWLILMLFHLQHLYYFAFKKDEAETSDEKIDRD
jgi:hypothetical protein